MGESKGKLPFWETVPLSEMSEEQWESLCDGCGKCCLNKLEDWDTGEIHFTNIACTLFDGQSCRCKDYENRFETVPDCLKLTPQSVPQYRWLPSTCAYRLVEEGRSLPKWHPLVSKSPHSVHEAGISVRNRVLSEDDIAEKDYEFHIVDWIEGGDFQKNEKIGK